MPHIFMIYFNLRHMHQNEQEFVNKDGCGEFKATVFKATQNTREHSNFTKLSNRTIALSG